MVADRVFSSLVPRRRTLSEAIVVVVAIGALAMRVLETPPSTPGLIRILFSVAVVSFVAFAPVQTLARRAYALIAAELLVGTLAFAFVDLPLVIDHRAQIGAAAVAGVLRVERFERTGSFR